MLAMLLFVGLLLGCCGSGLAVAVPRTWYVSVNATSGGDGTQGNPFQRISSGAAVAIPGDTVLVAGGVYRERVAPARSGTEHAPITYMAALGKTVVITAAEVLQWAPSPIQGGSFVAQLPDSLFDTLDGTPTGELYNPFLDPIQPNSGCNAIHTGQVYVDRAPLPEIGRRTIFINVSLDCTLFFFGSGALPDRTSFRGGRPAICHHPLGGVASQKCSER
jgi:hypothetical protein